MGLEEAAESERRSGVAAVDDDDEEMDDDDCDDDGDKIDRMLRRKLLKQQREMLAPVATPDDTPKEKIIEVAFINDRIPSYILVITKVYTSKKPPGEEGGNETPTLGTPIKTKDSEKITVESASPAIKTGGGEVAQDDARP